MQLISSRATFFYKRIFILCWFALLAICSLIVVISTVAAQRPLSEVAFSAGIPLLVMAFGWAIFRVTIMDVVDEVWDAGDALIVRNAGEEERLPLRELRRIHASMFINPERITLELDRNTAFGPRIAFLPQLRWIRLSINPLAAELMERVEAVRK